MRALGSVEKPFASPAADEDELMARAINNEGTIDRPGEVERVVDEG
jgi:hypothetical protein